MVEIRVKKGKAYHNDHLYKAGDVTDVPAAEAAWLVKHGNWEPAVKEAEPLPAQTPSEKPEPEKLLGGELKEEEPEKAPEEKHEEPPKPEKAKTSDVLGKLKNKR